MAHYLLTASYTNEGLHGLLKEGGTARVKAVKKLLASVGGKLEAMYWTFGRSDAILIIDLPDNVSAAAVAMRVSASGAVTVSTTVLLTAAEVDAAASAEVGYRPPGA